MGDNKYFKGCGTRYWGDKKYFKRCGTMYWGIISNTRGGAPGTGGY